MNKRERVLLFIVLGIAGCYGLFLLVKSAFLGPLETQAAQIRTLNSEITSKKKQMEEAIKASGQLAEWEKICLPGDEATAQALYEDFLYKLIRDCRFEGEPQVQPDKIERIKGSFTSIPFIIRGKITLENLIDFLYRFYQPNLLHQVRSLSISRDSSGKSLSVIMTVAGLAIDKAPDRDQLIAEEEKSRGPLLAGLTRKDFTLITQRNIFEPYREPTRETPKEPEVDAAKHVVLSGLPHAGEEPEAWLYNRLTRENRVLREGDDFEIAGVKGKVVSVARAEIVFEMNKKQWSLKLGKVLREMKELATTVSASTETNSEEKPAEKAKDEPVSDSSGDTPKAAESPSDDKPAKVGEKIQSDKIPSDSGSEASKAAAGS